MSILGFLCKFPSVRSFIVRVANSKDWMTAFNRRFEFTKYALIDKELFPVVQSYPGPKFYIHPDLCTLRESSSQYDFTGLKWGDIVIDIGANIGGFSLLAAQTTDNVHAFEPVLFEELRDNVNLNGNFWGGGPIKDITPYPYALGDGKPVEITWKGTDKQVIAPTITLTQMKELAGGCDFLKCDCEGAEWGIKIEELLSIRRIEIEFHSPIRNLELVDQIKEHFEVKMNSDENSGTFWVHGVRKNGV